MIDIHSHIINEIDDGARSLDESINLLRQMNSIGFNKMFVTPHYINGSKYIENNESKTEKLNNLKDILKKENIDLELYLGNEVFIDPDILKLIKSKKIATMNNSKYILIELPVFQMMNELFDILFELRSKGYVPIIAHPERYKYLQEDHSLINKFLEMGCLFQGNLENMVAKYGEHAKKLFLYMLKNNQYQFLATDVHHEDDILFKNIDDVKKAIIKIISLDKFILLTETNPLKIINNEEIEIIVEEEKKKFSLFHR